MPVQLTQGRMARLFAAAAAIVVATVVVMNQQSEASPTGGLSGTAFLSETSDSVGNPTGRFDAHWESEDGADFLEGPQESEIPRGLEWARRKAKTVLVQTADGRFYSAGTDIVAADDVAPWPASGLALEPRALAKEWKLSVRLASDASDDDHPTKEIAELIRASSFTRDVVLRRAQDGTRYVDCIIESTNAVSAATRLNDILARVPDDDRIKHGSEITVVAPVRD